MKSIHFVEQLKDMLLKLIRGAFDVVLWLTNAVIAAFDWIGAALTSQTVMVQAIILILIVVLLGLVAALARDFVRLVFRVFEILGTAIGYMVAAIPAVLVLLYALYAIAWFLDNFDHLKASLRTAGI